MDFKGCKVTEVRTGRIGTVITSDLEHVSIQYDDVRKINCPWSQVKFLDEKNRVSLNKALKKKSGTTSSTVHLPLRQNNTTPTVNKASQGTKLTEYVIIAFALLIVALSVLTNEKSAIGNRIEGRIFKKPFSNTQEIIARIDSITKTAEHCSRARVHYHMTGKDMKRGEAACDDYYDWKQNFFPRFQATHDVFKNDDVYRRLDYIRMLELAD